MVEIWVNGGRMVRLKVETGFWREWAVYGCFVAAKEEFI